jgi:hypothetical protein
MSLDEWWRWLRVACVVGTSCTSQCISVTGETKVLCDNPTPYSVSASVGFGDSLPDAQYGRAHFPSRTGVVQRGKAM